MRLRTLAVFLMAAVVVAAGCSKRSESVAIMPEVSIGAIHSGMTIQQVIAELGQPDQTNSSGFNFAHLGLQVNPGSGDTVLKVIVGPQFAGRTKDGIGIGSSRADVIQVYGEPTVARLGATTNYEYLRYSKRGLSFMLHDGKVHIMSVTFQPRK